MEKKNFLYTLICEWNNVIRCDSDLFCTFWYRHNRKIKKKRAECIHAIRTEDMISSLGLTPSNNSDVSFQHFSICLPSNDAYRTGPSAGAKTHTRPLGHFRLHWVRNNTDDLAICWMWLWHVRIRGRAIAGKRPPTIRRLHSVTKLLDRPFAMRISTENWKLWLE